MSPGCVVCRAGNSAPSLKEPVDYEYAVVPVRRFEYLRCTACDSEWLEPRPSAEELISFYPDTYHAYSDDHGFVAQVLVGIRAVLRGRKYRNLLSGGKGSLFDVGAGDSRHFRELKRYVELECAGVEIQPEMAAKARAAGFDVTTGTLESMDITPHLARYDIVSMNHVIEHVDDPVEVMRRVRDILKPRGWVVGQLPTNTGWESAVFGSAWAGYHYPRHLQVFSRRGLVEMLEGLGYQGVRIHSAPHCQIAISIQNALLAWGWKPRMQFGRSPIYGALLLASLPLEVAIAVLDRSGIIDFTARRAAS